VNGQKERRERLVGQLLPYFLSKMESFVPGGDFETMARSDAFALAERVMHDSDDREEQEGRDRLGRGRSER
jgi:hypothetical protein